MRRVQIFDGADVGYGNLMSWFAIGSEVLPEELEILGIGNGASGLGVDVVEELSEGWGRRVDLEEGKVVV